MDKKTCYAARATCLNTAALIRCNLSRAEQFIRILIQDTELDSAERQMLSTLLSETRLLRECESKLLQIGIGLTTAIGKPIE